jgi:glycosyltransferase involved in cell wall biosynthesis
MTSAYIFLSEAQRRLFRSLALREERVFVKGNLIPRIDRAPAPTEPMVVYAGRLAVNKGVEVLLAAWDRYLASRVGWEPTTDLQLVIAGAGPLEERIRAWASTRPSVRAAGFLGRAECADLIARARAVVVPSTWEEGFGLVAVEAMAVGVPVLASARGSLPELVTDGVDGRLFAPGDAGALAGVLGEVACEPEKYARLGCAARHSYEARFDPDANLDQLLSIYDFARWHPAT